MNQPPVVRVRTSVPPAHRMNQRMVEAFAREAQKHNVAVLLQNGVLVLPDGKTKMWSNDTLAWEPFKIGKDG